jgi:2-polyprenyl-6-methoxyphenol hydroxylase-like FAD-dependent oxidoreductase
MNQHIPHPKGYQHAVVIGSSIAGLLAARVLADHFEQVTVIERDQMPASATARKSVPQGNHVHLLLKSGELILRDLFPGLVDEMVAEGATVADAVADFRWLQYGKWKVKYDSGFKVLVQSRPFLEWQVRRKVSAISNVSFKYETAVTNLNTTPDLAAVAGVRVQKDGQQEEITADLIVDAGGPGSRTPQWLSDLNYQRPEETSVRIGLRYTSRYYKLPPQPRDWTGMIIYPKAPAQNRMGYIFSVEGNRWLVTLTSYLDDERPTSDEQFLAFARSLPSPEIYQVIKEAEPVSDLRSYHIPAETRRHYEKLARFPDGLVVIGDAFCRFDPIFGQGMSIAAKEAVLLGEMLTAVKGRQQLPNRQGFSSQFHKRVSKVVDTPWLLATTEVFRYPQVAGKRPFGIKLNHWYTAQIFDLCATDPTVYSAFQQVLNLLKGPEILFHPAILWRVLRHQLRKIGLPGSRQPSVANRTAIGDAS